MDNLRCERQIPNVSGLKDQELTVGRHVLLSCEGEINTEVNLPQIEVQLSEKDRHTVKVITAKLISPKNLDINLVFYSAGEFKFDSMVLTDGKNEIHLGSQQFKVESVIEKPKDGKPPEPYGAILPTTLAWPFLYTLITISGLLLISAIVFWFVQQKLRYKKLIAKLLDYESPVDADLQFYKSVRLAEASPQPFRDLEKAFRLYVLRVYRVPTFDLNQLQLLSFFKKENPWLKKERLELKKILSDFQLAEKKSSSVTKVELEQIKKQLVKKLYQFVDDSESFKGRKSL